MHQGTYWHRRLCSRRETLGLVVSIQGVKKSRGSVHVCLRNISRREGREGRRAIERLNKLSVTCLEEDLQGHLDQAALRFSPKNCVTLLIALELGSQNRPRLRTFPEPVTPNVANKPSRP